MQPTILPVILSALSLASAQSLQTIQVGNGLKFTPNTLTAKVGDSVQFTFFPKGHSVMQGSFEAPCDPLAGGFYSGEFQTATGENATSFTITVKDTNPIWFFCGVPGHCQGGMSGVINPAGNTLAAYQAASGTAAGSDSEPAVGGGVLGPVQSASTVSSKGSVPPPASSAAPVSASAFGSSTKAASAGTYSTAATSASGKAPTSVTAGAGTSISNGTAAPTYLAANNAMEARVQWVLMGATGLVAVAFGLVL